KILISVTSVFYKIYLTIWDINSTVFFIKKVDKAIVHCTCSASKMNLDKKFLEIAQRCANEVIVPVDITCCGFAGDKGFTTPELNDSALAPLKQQIPNDCTRGYSNSLTCEIGLTSHSGIFYRSIAYLVDECTT
ncbi:hypothetical protein SA679_07390, partial [Francisella sp. 19S2-10]|nr:hypothetical protein [Francisella sp. 19S2-4]MED7830585.1 hypothetical protein [Francisella sp. 19S2-10]